MSQRTPYATACSGANARDEITKILRRLVEGAARKVLARGARAQSQTCTRVRTHR
jgi:hypothetical protein